MEIIYTPKFQREFKKLPIGVKKITLIKESIFRNNPFNPILKTHKLHGKLKEFYSFSVDYDHRIIFEISENKNVFYFHSVSDHDIYK